MFKNLFSPDSGLMIAMGQVTDCIFLSLFWIMGCLPVVTLGASFAALYDSSFRAFREGNKHSWHRFLRVYLDNLKPGILPSLVFLAVLLAGGRGLILLWNAAVAGALPWAVFCVGAMAATAVTGILSVLFPMLSRFENSFPTLLKNTLLLSLAHFPGTLLLGIINAVTGYLCLRFIFPLFFLPSLAALLGSLLLEPMFRPYMNN